jgi:cell division protein FtsB
MIAKWREGISMTKCWKCGADNDDDYQFCKSCGQYRFAGKGYLIINQSGKARFLKFRTFMLILLLTVAAFGYILYLNNYNYAAAENYYFLATDLQNQLDPLQKECDELSQANRDLLDSMSVMYTAEEVESLRQVFRDEMIEDLNWRDQNGDLITTEEQYWKYSDWFAKNINFMG